MEIIISGGVYQPQPIGVLPYHDNILIHEIDIVLTIKSNLAGIAAMTTHSDADFTVSRNNQGSITQGVWADGDQG